MAPNYASRRAFLVSTGAFFTLPALAGGQSSFEYVGSVDSIDVFQSDRGRRRKIQSVASRRPSFVALDDSRTFLFAVNEIAAFNGLPTGSVESYRVGADGRLSLINRRSLSLSATLPKHLAIGPDRRHLVVCAYGGGAYNVLPVDASGGLGPVTQVVKEIGRGTHPERQAAAHPHSAVFHPSGKFLVTTDLGSDRINLFAFENGRMTLLQRLATRAGSGPARLTIDSNGSLLSVLHELRPLLSCYRFDSETGRIACVAEISDNRQIQLALPSFS